VLAALEGKEGLLTVAPTAESSVRGKIAVDDTDLKETLTNLYDSFVERRTREMVAQREEELARIERAQAERERLVKKWIEMAKPESERQARELLVEERKEEAEGMAEASLPPGYTDGSGAEFTVMKESIGRGEAGKVLLSEAVGWRWVGPDQVKGRWYDAGMVRLGTPTVFGVFESELKALHEDGRIVRWVYPATNEPVER
jgi:hypothetical protein